MTFQPRVLTDYELMTFQPRVFKNLICNRCMYILHFNNKSFYNERHYKQLSIIKKLPKLPLQYRKQLN